METTWDVIVIGAGIAGLTSAIHLSMMGISVAVIEKHSIPRHKVCGEYISNEVLPYINWLGIYPEKAGATAISRVIVSGSDGKTATGKLPLGGFGLSRYTFDKLLFEKAVENGAILLIDSVTDVKYSDDNFAVTTEKNGIMNARIVLGAFGKRSALDKKLQRDFMEKDMQWLAAKAHYSGDFSNDCVGLYNFKGGYCGISKVENDIVNVCWLANYDTFKKYKDIAQYEKEVVQQNPQLKTFFDNSSRVFEKPLTISQISFDRKKPVENHVLMTGDSAGLIHPLCGNGMAMAIHSAKIAAELSLAFLANKMNRNAMETEYTQKWNATFRQRIRNGRRIARLMRSEKISRLAMSLLVAFPALLPKIIKTTHGKPLTAPV